ncbi:MAG: hypothetical protein AAB598_00825 [Patescibacteria group bacterium]
MDYEQEIKFVRKFFCDRIDKSGLPLWQHSVNVAHTLEEYIAQYNEVRGMIKNDLLLGALGHDLLEDTNASAEEIERQWGGKALFYIQEMTNTQGDNNTKDYIEHLTRVDEEILLIKFADILANIRNSIKNASALPSKWLVHFWIPLLDRYEAALLSKIFHKYPLTLDAMAQEIKNNITQIKKIQISATYPSKIGE